MAGWSLGDVPEGSSQQRSMEGDRVLLLTEEPVVAVQQVTTWALERGVELGRFSVTQPTLEDIYLELTGSRSGRPEVVHAEKTIQ